MAAIGSLGGLYYFGVAIECLFGYVQDKTSEVRHEYLEGVTLALIISIPFWLFVSASLFPIRSELSKGIYIAWNSPAIILVTAFVAMNIYILVGIMVFNAT